MRLKQILEQVIDEFQDAHGFSAVIPYLEKKLNIKVGKRINSGTMSDVFDLGDKVLKITSTPHDAGGLYLGMQHPEYPIPKVYSLYRLSNTEFKKNSNNFNFTNYLSEKKLWVAVVEKVKPVTPTQKQIDYLYNWFVKNTKFTPGDITDENVGKDSRGRLVYLDPAFYESIEYANTIPVLK